MVLNSITHIIKNFCLCNLTLLLYELCYLIECDWAWLEQLCLRVISYVWNIYWFGRSNDNYKVWVFSVCLCMWVCIRRTCLHYTWTTQRTTTSTLSSTVLHVPHCVILLIRTWTRLTTGCCLTMWIYGFVSWMFWMFDTKWSAFVRFYVAKLEPVYSSFFNYKFWNRFNFNH